LWNWQKQSTIAMVGIGSLHSETSSFFQFTYMSQDEVREIINDQKAVGEVLAHVYNIDGQECAHDYRNRLIGINLDDLKKNPSFNWDCQFYKQNKFNYWRITRWHY
jgi:Transcriptional regulator, contains sigma factor-related N-terminal domain